MYKINRKIIIIDGILIAGIVLWIISLLTRKYEYILSFNFFSWSDFYVTLEFTTGNMESLGNYFPFAYLIAKILRIISFGDYSTTYIFVQTMLTSFIYFILSSLLKDCIDNKKILIFILIFMQYPYIYELGRGNIELILFFFCLLFYYFYRKEKYQLSALMLSFAISMKLYPLLLSLIFLCNKKYKAFVTCIISTILLTLFSYIALYNVFGNIMDYVDRFSNFVDGYSNTRLALQHNHSILIGIISIIYLITKENIEILLSGTATQIYSIIIIIVSIILVLFVLIRKMPNWKRLTILTLMMTSFPTISYDYTLLALMIPIVAFILDNNTTKRQDIIYSLLLTLQLVPMRWFEIQYIDRLPNEGLIIRPLLTVVTIVIIILSTFLKSNKMKKSDFYDYIDK